MKDLTYLLEITPVQKLIYVAGTALFTASHYLQAGMTDDGIELLKDEIWGIRRSLERIERHMEEEAKK